MLETAILQRLALLVGGLLWDGGCCYVEEKIIEGVEAREPHLCHPPLVTPSHPLLSSQFAHLKTGSQNELICRIEALPLVLT